MVSIYPARSKTMDAAHVTAGLDPQTHTIWLDVAIHTTSWGEAETLARQHGQIAYFDLVNGKSVTVAPVG